MRICILTQPLHSNYGGLLQAYAMQVVLRQMGHEVWTEDRRVDHFSPLRSLLRSDLVRGIMGLKRYLTADEKAIIQQHTNKFISDNIRTTLPIYSTNKRPLEQYQFDAYVVGSDQVWRKEYSCGIENYFLDFVSDSSLKIAYAASFGVSHWEFGAAQSRALSKLAQRFDLIGVREADAVALCRENLGVEAHHVLDPTMLLPKSAYLELIKQSYGYTLGQGGVATYLLDPNSKKEGVAHRIASSLGVDINSLGHTLNNNLYNGTAAQQRVVPPVANWLAGIFNSEYVVTDSFHGVVFAILFNKPFVLLANRERGISRFISLLELFDLQDRMILDVDSFDDALLQKPIDYQYVNAQLQSLQLASIKLLSKALDTSR